MIADNISAQGMPRVSVVIPTCNRAGTIMMALNSVLQQSASILEVIVVDDCSDDNTQEILRAVTDPRVRIVKTLKRSGAPLARNLGASHCKGDWIAFQDSDDYWFAFKLEQQLARLKEQPDAILCYCGLIQFYGGDVNLIPGPEAQQVEGGLYETLLATSLISTQTIVVKREAFESCGGFKPDMPRLQDWELVLRLAKLGPFCCVRAPLVLAYATPGNLTSDLRKGIAARRKILDIHAAELAARPALLKRHLHIIGKQLLALGDRQEALTSFWAAIKLQPQQLNSWYWALVSALRLVSYPKPSGQGK